MSERDWTLDASARAARGILSAETDCDLSSWKTVVRGYREAKGALIAALDPATGRRELDYAPAVSDADRCAAYRNSCGMLVGHARAKLDTTRAALASARDLPADHAEREKILARAESAAARAEALMAHAQTHLVAVSEWSYAVSNGEILADAVSSPLAERYAPGTVRAGQKLGRALASVLRGLGATADTAAQLVNLISSNAAPKRRAGKIVLSANILDLLCCSVGCSYSSCHGLDGCHRAGPQAYLQDSHTVVAYYFEEYRHYGGGERLPYKLYRQLAYLDGERGAALMMRTYGQQLPECGQQTVRREVACALARLADPTATVEPVWYRKDCDGTHTLLPDRRKLAYLDPVSCYVQLAKGAESRAQITLARRVPCPQCGDELEEPGQLTCCADDDTYRCDSCNCRLSEDETYSAEGGDGTYCADCYGEQYSRCTGIIVRNGRSRECGTEVYCDDATEGPDGPLCQRCYETSYVTCAQCDAVVHQDDSANDDEHTYCVECYETHGRRECRTCEEWTEPNELTARGECAECGQSWALWSRLRGSPLWTRLPAGERGALAALWGNVLSVNPSTYLESV